MAVAERTPVVPQCPSEDLASLLSGSLTTQRATAPQNSRPDPSTGAPTSAEAAWLPAASPELQPAPREQEKGLGRPQNGGNLEVLTRSCSEEGKNNPG